MIKFLDLYGQYQSIAPEIDAAISEVIRQSAFIGGAPVQTFEREFAAYQEAEHCVGVGNGTDAIEIVLEAFGLPKGSEVLVPANTFIASSEAVTRAGHTPVFCDVEEDSYTIDINDLESRINEKTHAIIAVHLYGHPCDMDAILALARRHNLRVVEDCAQAHGARYKGRRVGALGDAGTFSFYPGKNLGAYGDGGAIVTNDKDLAGRCRMIANHGRVDKYDHLFEGRNSRLDGLQASILSVKLKHLDSWIKRRNEIGVYYNEHLRGVGDVITPRTADDAFHAYHLYVVRTRQRAALIAHLGKNGIQCGIHYPIALPRLKAYAHLQIHQNTARADRMATEVLSLPIGEHLTKEDALAVVGCVRSFFGRA